MSLMAMTHASMLLSLTGAKSLSDGYVPLISDSKGTRAAVTFVLSLSRVISL